MNPIHGIDVSNNRLLIIIKLFSRKSSLDKSHNEMKNTKIKKKIQQNCETKISYAVNRNKFIHFVISEKKIFACKVKSYTRRSNTCSLKVNLKIFTAGTELMTRH